MSTLQEQALAFCLKIVDTSFHIRNVEVSVPSRETAKHFVIARFAVNHAWNHPRTAEWARERIEARIPKWSTMGGRHVAFEEEITEGDGIVRWIIVGFQFPFVEA